MMSTAQSAWSIHSREARLLTLLTSACLCRCLVTEDCDAGHVVLRYLRTVVAPALPLGDEISARLSHLLSARGPGLMMALLGAVCGAMPSNMLEDVILTLVALLRAAGVDAFLRYHTPASACLFLLLD